MSMESLHLFGDSGMLSNLSKHRKQRRKSSSESKSSFGLIWLFDLWPRDPQSRSFHAVGPWTLVSVGIKIDSFIQSQHSFSLGYSCSQV